jgi:flagellar biogenesis protein FliO
MEWVLIKTLLSLVLVLALMVGVVVVLKKSMYGRTSKRSSAVDIELLGSRILQPKRSVFVLRVLNKVFVIGSSESGMQTLTEIDDDKSLMQLEEQQAESSGEAANALPFSTYLNKSLSALRWKFKHNTPSRRAASAEVRE